MYSIEELSSVCDAAWFQLSYRELERDILRSRLGLELVSTKRQEKLRGLRRFTGAVLASLPNWENCRAGIARRICLCAADIEAALALINLRTPDTSSHKTHVLRSAILYDIAGMAGVAAAFVERDGLALDTKHFFGRKGEWGQLSIRSVDVPSSNSLRSADSDADTLIDDAVGQVLHAYGNLIQKHGDDTRAPDRDLARLDAIVGEFSSFLSRDEFAGIRKSLELRIENSTLAITPRHSSLAEPTLRSLKLPTEMWPVQRTALEQGLLSEDVRSFGLASPTGSGKTSLMRLLIADFLQKNPGKKAIYISPSRALTAQIAKDLSESLNNIGAKVLALGAHLSVPFVTIVEPDDADVLVFTPEKADLMMRIMPESMASVGLVIIDEAHHIEQGTRGILLEFYLWRLRSLAPASARFIQLSAVTPNIDELVGWLAEDNRKARSLTSDQRTSPLRVGIFERRQDGSAVVQFGADAPYVLLQSGECPSDPEENLAILASRLAQKGVVLVLSTSTQGAEDIAEKIASQRERIETSNIRIDNLDARVERELYPDAPLREYIRRRVVFHHAQLPPRVRHSIEECIANRDVDVVCATTTLGEGVNFPFSTVIVESLVGKGYQLSPRSLWNIAGRAGRFGVDVEGHCILFRPSRWKSKLSGYALEDYLRTNLADIPPVRSALATAIVQLKKAVEDGAIDFDKLGSISLSEIRATTPSAAASVKTARGLVNLMRVGYAHANVSQTIAVDVDDAPEFDGQLLAAEQMSEDQRAFAKRLGGQQRGVIRRALSEDANLVQIAARIGWSLESQNSLFVWVSSLQDWQLEQFGDLVLGGKILEPAKLGYLIGPLSKYMTEFEGDALGGYTSYIAVNWLKGLPLVEIQRSQKNMAFGRLVKVIYSRIHYMLPWALFGLHELVQYEARRRRIEVGSGIRDLSMLAAEGVPNFDALTLTIRLDVERADATRLSVNYQRGRSATDVVSWFRSRSWEVILGIVRGGDSRRLDPDLRRIWENAQAVP